MRESKSRYSTVSIVLHWTIFVLIFLNATFGGWMEESEPSEWLGYFQLHKSVGISILALSLIRLGWRLGHQWPSFPGAMPLWERILARTTHVIFYALMIGAPLMGWAAASAGGAPDVALFRIIPAPNLPLAESDAMADSLGGIHKLMVKSIYIVLGLHVLGALKHHFFDHDEVLTRMLPWASRLRRKS